MEDHRGHVRPEVATQQTDGRVSAVNLGVGVGGSSASFWPWGSPPNPKPRSAGVSTGADRPWEEGRDNETAALFFRGIHESSPQKVRDLSGQWTADRTPTRYSIATWWPEEDLQPRGQPWLLPLEQELKGWHAGVVGTLGDAVSVSLAVTLPFKQITKSYNKGRKFHCLGHEMHSQKGNGWARCNTRLWPCVHRDPVLYLS